MPHSLNETLSTNLESEVNFLKYEDAVKLSPDDPRRCQFVLTYLSHGMAAGLGQFELDTIKAALLRRSQQPPDPTPDDCLGN